MGSCVTGKDQYAHTYTFSHRSSCIILTHTTSAEHSRLMRGNSHNPSSEADIIEAELFEEEPEFKPVCLGDDPYLGE